MQNSVVKLTSVTHKNQSIIKLEFEKNIELYKLVRQLPNLNYSKTHGAWYLPYTIDAVQIICNKLNTAAFVDCSTLKNTIPIPSVILKTSPAPIKPNNLLAQLSAEKLTEILCFKKWLLSKRYSLSTIGTYCDSLTTFLRYFNTLNTNQITNQHLIDFNNDYILKNKFSASFQNQIVNAVKLFYSTMQHKQLQLELIHRPKNPKLLPNVLSS